MFDNLKIRTKIGILAGIMMTFILLIGAIGYINLSKANENIKMMYNDNLTAIKILNDNRAHARAIEADIYSIMLNTDNTDEQKLKMEDIEKRVGIFNSSFQQYKSGQLSQFEQDTIPELEKNLAMYRDGREKVLALALAGKGEEAKAAYSVIQNAADAFQNSLRDLSEFNVKNAETLMSHTNAAYARTMKLFVGIMAIALAASIGITLFISNTINRPLKVALDHIGEVAQYNIAKDIPVVFANRNDEMGDLARAIQKIEENLRSLLKSIADTSEHVAASSQELTSTSQQAATAAEEVSRAIEEIAKGATEQAQNTTEGASELMSLGDLIEDDKRNIGILNETSASVDKLIQQGLDVINNLSMKTQESGSAANVVYESVKKTNESSEKINEASSLIASIAQQTNLLALNAAIEAARAGEYGRGFSVVADEIRILAEQSTESTAIIDDMVKLLQHDSKEAVSIMERMEKILAEQVENVSLTESKYNEISNAMKKSTEAVRAINETGLLVDRKKNEVLGTIQNLSAIAEENAAGSQQASASIEEQTASMDAIANASEGLSLLSQELQGLIARFKM